MGLGETVCTWAGTGAGAGHLPLLGVLASFCSSPMDNACLTRQGDVLYTAGKGNGLKKKNGHLESFRVRRLLNPPWTEGGRKTEIGLSSFI